MQIFDIDRIKVATIVVIGDEPRWRCIWVFLHLLVIVDGGEHAECADEVVIKRLCPLSQLRSKRALGHIVRR